MTNLAQPNLQQAWETAINKHDLDAVLDCYAPQATLLPTVSNTLCNTPEKIKAYFEAFLAKKPHVNWVDSHWDEFSDGWVQSGRYDFSFASGDTVTARYTFAYKKINDKWHIISHHSSKNPV